MEEIFSPAMQEAVRLANSPKIQAMLRLMNSPVIQESLRFSNSSAVQEVIQHVMSPAVEDALARIHGGYGCTEKSLSSEEQSLDKIFCSTEKSNRLAQSFCSAVSISAPYVNANAGNENSTKTDTPTVEPKIKLKQQLSMSDILTLIGILMTFFSIIISCLPNEQLTRIIEQNDTIIEQQAEIIELSEEDLALRQTLEQLTDCINLFAEEIEPFREGTKDVNNPVGCDSQTETDDAK